MKTNKAVKLPPIETHEGGQAVRINHNQQLRRSVLSCLLWEDEFYESGEQIAARIFNTASECSPEFVAALAIEARTEHNLRHAPLLLLLNLIARAAPGTDKTIAKVVSRADEITELCSMWWQATLRSASAKGRRTNTPLTAAMKRGLAAAFHKFDEYQFAKWDQKDAGVKLRDVLRLVHPKPTSKEQAELFGRIKNGTLARPDTWESRLAGGEDKRAVFTDLLERKKLGSLALLRNLRGMDQAGVDHQIIKDAIINTKHDKTLPYRFIAAAKRAPMFEQELDIAMQASMAGIEKLPGCTVVLVDVSGSMKEPLSAKSDLRRSDAAAGLAILLRGISGNCRVFIFGDTTREVPARSGMALRDLVVYQNENTYLGDALKHVLRIPHDRLVVITDEQTQDRLPDPVAKRSYMLNVASAKNGVGYGKWIHIDGFSEACVKYMHAYEQAEIVVRRE